MEEEKLFQKKNYGKMSPKNEFYNFKFIAKKYTLNFI